MSYVQHPSAVSAPCTLLGDEAQMVEGGCLDIYGPPVGPGYSIGFNGQQCDDGGYCVIVCGSSC